MGKYNLFISHSWTKDSELTNLTNLLNAKKYFTFEYTEFRKHNSVDSIHEEYIKKRIRENLEKSDVVLVMGHVSASYSAWIEYELKKAHEFGIKIIGIRPCGQERISTLVQDYADELVYWSTDSIVSAIQNQGR